MPAPLDPDKRAAIEEAIRAGGTRNAIAREHSVSGSTVGKIAKDLESELGAPAFDRANTKRATAARATDLSARRVQLAEQLLEDAFLLRERMWNGQFDVVGVKQGEAVEVERPTNAGEFRNYMTAIGIAVDKVGVLTRDESEGLAAVDAWLRSVVGS